MLSSSVAKEGWSKWSLDWSSHFIVLDHGVSKWVLSIVEEGFETASEHLFESKGHDAVVLTTSDRVLSKVEGSAASGTVVVDVYYGHTSHTLSVHSVLP